MTFANYLVLLYHLFYGEQVLPCEVSPLLLVQVLVALEELLDLLVVEPGLALDLKRVKDVLK